MAAKQSLCALIASIAAAAFGVQSQDKLERDFAHRSAWPFIIGGLLGTLLFVLALWWLVDWVLASQR